MLEQGFLGTRAPLILDIIAVMLVLVILLQGFSIYLVKRRAYNWHKRIQLGIGYGMGALLLWFEVQMRLVGWRHLAEDSEYFDTYLYPVLLLHLVFAIPTFLLWIVTIYGALKNFSKPPKPSKYSMIHKRLGKISLIFSSGTIVTAWLFYWLAFVS